MRKTQKDKGVAVPTDPPNIFAKDFCKIPIAEQVNKSVDIRTNFQSIPWRAVAAAEQDVHAPASRR